MGPNRAASPDDDDARLFVAVTLPASIEKIVGSLPRPAIAGVRWTGVAQWHVTLRFLGRVSPVAVRAALGGLDHAVVRAELGREVTALGRGVLCVRVGGLDELAAAVVDRTRDVGEPPDARGFAGHLTVARVNRPAGAGRRIASLVGLPVPAGSWPVREIELVRSDLDPGGARYSTVERFALRG